MPYVTAIERMAEEQGLQRGELRGLQRGIELALELKYGPDGLQLLPLVRAVSRIEVLRTAEQAIRAGRTLDDVRSLLT